MSYQKLIVGLADTQVAPQVMKAASILAAEHSAHLVGVHVVPSMLPIDRGLSKEERIDSLHGIFQEHCKGGTYTHEWRVVDDDRLSVSDSLIELGNTADAIVLGQRHGNEADRLNWHLAEHVVGVTARPVVLVPASGDAAPSTRRILLAWNGGESATRVAFDSLPLLQRAEQVILHRFNPPPAERQHVAGIAEGFAEALSRHGVPLELSHSDVSPRDIGEEIIALGNRHEVDLLVMGCRVHSRLRQFLFGSTTRHVFEHATRPVVMGG